MPEVVKVGIGCIFQPSGFDSIDGHDVGRRHFTVVRPRHIDAFELLP